MGKGRLFFIASLLVLCIIAVAAYMTLPDCNINFRGIDCSIDAIIVVDYGASLLSPRDYGASLLRDYGASLLSPRITMTVYSIQRGERVFTRRRGGYASRSPARETLVSSPRLRASA